MRSRHFSFKIALNFKRLLLARTLMMQRDKLHFKYTHWLKETLPTSEISGVLIYGLAIKDCCFKLCCSKTSIINLAGSHCHLFFSFFLCSHVSYNEEGIL